MFTMNGITSTNKVKVPPKIILPILLLFFSLAWTFCCSVSSIVFGSPDVARNQMPVVFAVTALLGLIPAIGSFVWILSTKSTYAVIVSTAAQEVQAVETPDESVADEILDAIDDALAHRG